MAEIYTFAFVEDAPSQAALSKIVDYVNNGRKNHFHLNTPPVITNGSGNLRKTATRFLGAGNKVCSIFVTDLDNAFSPTALCNDWFKLPCFGLLPKAMIFRVACHEIESWIIADKVGLANFLEISDVNFSDTPDQLADPKKSLYDVIKSKCRKKKFLDMLPQKGQAVGIEYNPMLTEFIKNTWSIEQAMSRSPSLMRAVNRMTSRLENYAG